MSSAGPCGLAQVLVSNKHANRKQENKGFTGLCAESAAIHQAMVLQVAELQQNYSDWLSQQAGEQDAAHEMQRALREAQGDSQALRHKLSAAQQQHSRAEAKYHSQVGQAGTAGSVSPPHGQTCLCWDCCTVDCRQSKHGSCAGAALH